MCGQILKVARSLFEKESGKGELIGSRLTRRSGGSSHLALPGEPQVLPLPFVADFESWLPSEKKSVKGKLAH